MLLKSIKGASGAVKLALLILSLPRPPESLLLLNSAPFWVNSNADTSQGNADLALCVALPLLGLIIEFDGILVHILPTAETQLPPTLSRLARRLRCLHFCVSGSRR
jgi:hypothetical protein